MRRPLGGRQRKGKARALISALLGASACGCEATKPEPPANGKAEPASAPVASAVEPTRVPLPPLDLRNYRVYAEDDLHVVRGLPLLDLSGYGWGSYEDYIRDVRDIHAPRSAKDPPAASLLLFELAGDAPERLFDELWPGALKAFDEAKRTGDPISPEFKAPYPFDQVSVVDNSRELYEHVPGAERGFIVKQLVFPDTPELRKLKEAACQTLAQVHVTIDGNEVPLARALFVDVRWGRIAIAAFVTVPKKKLTVTLTKGAARKAFELPLDAPRTAHAVVRRRGRAIDCVSDRILIDPFDLEKSSGMWCFLDDFVWCLHPFQRR